MMIEEGRTARRHDRRRPDLRCRSGSLRPARDLATPDTAVTAGTGPLLTAEVV
jgi:hypothetical protein